MTAPKYVLLSSAPTLGSITRAINDFWCSDHYTVNAETLHIEHPVRVPPGYRVIKKAGRYRFEAEE